MDSVGFYGVSLSSQCTTLLPSGGWQLEKEPAGALIALRDANLQIPEWFAQKEEMNGICDSLATLEKCPASQSPMKMFIVYC